MRIRGDWILVTLLLVAGQRLVGNTEIYAPVNGELIDSLNTTTVSARTISIQSPNGFELVLSPDGSTFYVLFVNYWNTILAVDSSTGAVKQQYHTTYQRWDNFLSSIPFYVSADESRFIVGTCADNVEGTCQAGFAEVFDVAGGEEVGMISMGGDEVSGVALSADGSTGYAGHFYNFVCVGCDGAPGRAPVPSDALTEFSIPTMTVLKNLPMNPAPGKMVLNSSGTILYTSGGAIAAVSVPDLTLLNQVGVSIGTNEIALSANGAVIATTQSFYNQVQFNDFVDFFNAADLSAIGTVTLAPDTTNTHISLDPEGQYAYVGPGPYQISSKALSVVQTYNVGYSADVALSVDGTSVFPFVTSGTNLGQFLGAKADTLRLLPLSAAPQTLTLSAEGDLLYEGGMNGIGVVATVSGRLKGTILSGTNITALASSAGSKALYAGDTFGNIYKVETGSVKEIIPETQIAPASICLSPDGNKLVISSPTLIIYSTVTGRRTTFSISGFVSSSGPCAVDPTNSFAYVTYTGADSVANIAVIDLSTGEQTGNLNFGGGPIVFASSQQLAYIGVENAIDVVDTASGAILSTISLPNITPTGAALAPDGSALYVAGNPKGVVIDTLTMETKPFYATGPVVAH